MSRPLLDVSHADEASVHAAWADYADAARRAQFSRRIEDGVAAGKAWKAFLDLFVRPAPPSNVVDLRPRGPSAT